MMNKADSHSKITEFCGRPRIEHSYPSRPSWKSYGDGRASIEITLDSDGSLDIHCAEIPEGLRGIKETYVTLPRDLAVALAKAINEWRKS